MKYFAWYEDEHDRPQVIPLEAKQDRAACEQARALIRECCAYAKARAEARGITLRVRRGCYELLALENVDGNYWVVAKRLRN